MSSAGLLLVAKIWKTCWTSHLSYSFWTVCNGLCAKGKQACPSELQTQDTNKILLAMPVSQEQKAAEHLFIKNIMARIIGSVSFHYIALQDMHWDHCSCSSQGKTKSVSPCRSIYPESNRQGRRERKDLLVSADEKRRWSEIPELRQETCGRTTNWTMFRIAEDADWGELTACRFFWLTRSVKKKPNKPTKLLQNHCNARIAWGRLLLVCVRPQHWNSVWHSVTQAGKDKLRWEQVQQE